MDEKQSGYIRALARHTLAGLSPEDQADVAAEMLHLLSDNRVPAEVFRDAPRIFAALDPDLINKATGEMMDASLIEAMLNKAAAERKMLRLLDGGSDAA